MKFKKVESIKIREVENEFVYDIELEKNHYFSSNKIISHNCRLRSDMNAFEKETFGSIGGSGSAKIGSIGVVTINLPRVAFRYKAGEIDSIEEEIKRLTHMTVKINYARRMLIKDKIERNMMPVYSDGFMVLNRQFSTTGILGGYEFSKILGIDIKTDEGMDAQINLLKVIRETQDEIHKDPMYKEVPFNVEQVPAETTSSKLPLKDKILGINNIGLKLYSNQFIPLQETANLLDRIRIAGTMDSSDMLNGGSILHLNADQRIESVERMEELIYTVAKFGVMYWAINFDLLYCESCHTFEIKENKSGVCKHCGSTDTSSYIRVVGFLTKVKSWSDVKQNEDYAKRQMYSNI